MDFTLQQLGLTAIVQFPEHVVGGEDAVRLAGLVNQATSAGAVKLVFDLQQVALMNSSGLGMLVGSLTTLQKQQIPLVLAAVSDKVASLLKVTQLTQVFTIVDTVAEATQQS